MFAAFGVMGQGAHGPGRAPRDVFQGETLRKDSIQKNDILGPQKLFLAMLKKNAPENWPGPGPQAGTGSERGRPGKDKAGTRPGRDCRPWTQGQGPGLRPRRAREEAGRARTRPGRARPTVSHALDNLCQNIITNF